MVTSINSLSIGRGAKKKRYGQKGCSPRADVNDRMVEEIDAFLPKEESYPFVPRHAEVNQK